MYMSKGLIWLQIKSSSALFKGQKWLESNHPNLRRLFDQSFMIAILFKIVQMHITMPQEL
jgi:hypothetical protein